MSSGKASILPGPRDRPGSRRLNKYITRNARFQRPKHFNDRKKTVTVTTRQSTIRSTKSCTLNDPSEQNLEHKKLHAQRPIRSTIWSTRSCTLNDPSGARFGAQKVARSSIHPEHALEHKKLHAQRPIRSTLWSTKSCTLNDPSGARFGAQKVARSTTHPEHALEHKKLHAQRPIRSTLWSTKSCTLNDPSGARFGAQKVARSTTYPEHALEHKKLHAQRPIRSTLWSTKSLHVQRPIRSTENSLECPVVSEAPTTFTRVGLHKFKATSGVLFLLSFLFVELKTPKKAPFIPQKIARKTRQLFQKVATK